MVSPGFFETMQMRLVRGRFFDDRDREGAPPVAVVTKPSRTATGRIRIPTGKRFVFGTSRPA